MDDKARENAARISAMGVGDVVACVHDPDRLGPCDGTVLEIPDILHYVEPGFQILECLQRPESPRSETPGRLYFHLAAGLSDEHWRYEPRGLPDFWGWFLFEHTGRSVSDTGMRWHWKHHWSRAAVPTGHLQRLHTRDIFPRSSCIRAPGESY